MRSGTHFGYLATPQLLPRVVARAFLSCALVMRVQIETHPARGEAADLLGAVRGWLESSGFEAELEPAERLALDRPIGELTREEADAFGWYGEAACVLAWAVQRAVIPAVDQPADALEIAGALDWLTEAGAALRTGARMRPREQLSAYLEIAGAAEWRARAAAESPARVSMSRWGSDRLEWPPDVTPFEIVADDLALGGRPITQADAPALLRVAKVLRERHRAALWLLGQAPVYSDVVLPG